MVRHESTDIGHLIPDALQKVEAHGGDGTEAKAR